MRDTYTPMGMLHRLLILNQYQTGQFEGKTLAPFLPSPTLQYPFPIGLVGLPFADFALYVLCEVWKRIPLSINELRISGCQWETGIAPTDS